MGIVWIFFCIIVICLFIFTIIKLRILWIFFGIIAFCLYILFGLHITNDIDKTSALVFTWVIYTCLWITFVNMFLLGYYWSTLRTKQGPTGIRGPAGETGDSGIEGSCSIDSTKALIMQQLNTYIDELYKAHSGKNILNTNTQQFPCTYLNNKVSAQSGSRQYAVIIATLSNQNKPVLDIINYMKSIWKIWFDLIYNANPEWFIDEHADEDYKWLTTNPFTEIKKYDLYYWGITRTFRPLKAELCRSTPNYDSAKFPIKPRTRLKIIQSNDYSFITDDKRTRARIDSSWWRPKIVSIGSDTYYPVGDILTAGNSNIVWSKNNFGKSKTTIGDITYDGFAEGPNIKSILVSGDVVDPINYYDNRFIGKNYNWHEFTSNRNLRTSSLTCPEGYVSLGDIISAHDGKNTTLNMPIKCIPSDCVIDNNRKNNAKNTWYNQQNSHPLTNLNTLNEWDTNNNDATGDNGYNTFRIKQNGKPFYRIKDECLAPQVGPSTKEPEKEFTDLGIGWYGHPYKLDPKYSIFTFLNLVPEGMIVNKSSGRRFYIIHYGGEDVNIYNVLDYNSNTDKFDNSLQVDSKPSSAKVLSRNLSRRDERQQWTIILQSDTKYLKLKNIMNNRYLFLGLSPSRGEAQFSTIDLDFDNYKKQESLKRIYSSLSQTQIDDNTTFTFISTFGTQMNIIDEEQNKLKPLFVTGNRIRISSQANQPISLFGIFVYDDTGRLISSMADTQNKKLASSSSIYQGHKASNALKILTDNIDRNINKAIDNEKLKNKEIGWNTYSKNGSLVAYTNNDKSATTGGAWWEYKFNNDVKIAGIEIYNDWIYNVERMDNMLVEIFDSNNKVIWDDKTGSRADIKLFQGIALFIINKNGTIH